MADPFAPVIKRLKVEGEAVLHVRCPASHAHCLEFGVSGERTITGMIKDPMPADPVEPRKGGPAWFLPDEGGNEGRLRHRLLETGPLDLLVCQPQLRSLDHQPGQNPTQGILDREMANGQSLIRVYMDLGQERVEIEHQSPP